MTARTWFWASVLVYAVLVLWARTTLPEGDVPLHFGGDGSPDRFGSRADAITLFVGAGLVVGGLMAVLAWLVGSGRVPFGLVNIPHKGYWQHHQPEARGMLRDDMCVLGAMTMALLSAVLVVTVSAARGSGVAGPLWGALLLYLAAVLAWSLHALGARYRPPREA